MRQYLNEINRALARTANPKDAEYKNFRQKTTKLPVLGHRLPVLHKILKNGFSFFNKSDAEILNIWNYIFLNAKTHEAMYLPLLYYAKHVGVQYIEPQPKQQWQKFRFWVERIENWEHSDFYSKIVSFLLEKHPRLIWPTIKKWNKSNNPWKQRNSIVPLIYYASPKRKPPPVQKILPLVENLLESRDPYVQKAVGWTLRECGKVYPKETFVFLTLHARKLSATSWSYATEKISTKQKAYLRRKRK
ncbi:MAG: hypothetical protein ACD_76C00124G0003 [uncultured bacterium]|nr:MAG: hypothetical protein ACD_76C00124G0003 [uncultured bacterium]HBD05159.1 hypothetical protein [Candidatus Uhrbacteria bacterium]